MLGVSEVVPTALMLLIVLKCFMIILHNVQKEKEKKNIMTVEM